MFLYERYLNETINVLTLPFHWYWAKYESYLCFSPILSHAAWSVFSSAVEQTRRSLWALFCYSWTDWCRGRLVCHTAMLPSDRTLVHIYLSHRHGTIVPYSYNNLLIGFYYEIFLSCYLQLMFISTEIWQLLKISIRLVWWVCRAVLTFEVTRPVDPACTSLKSFLNIC